MVMAENNFTTTKVIGESFVYRPFSGYRPFLFLIEYDEQTYLFLSYLYITYLYMSTMRIHLVISILKFAL